MARKNFETSNYCGIVDNFIIRDACSQSSVSREEANTSTQPTTTISQPEAVTAKAKDGVVTLKR